jgi:membrane associated rhomboid family serine protease
VQRFKPILTVVGLCWLLFLVNNGLFQGHLNQYGIAPRHLEGLLGILWAPFLHSSYGHLAANTLPLLFLGGIICVRSRSEFTFVTVAGILLGGGLTWLFARTASHIGASGLVFCFFGYLASLACFQRTPGTLILSGLCILAYGGIVRGLLPTATAVSWESHVAGLVSGIAIAWFLSKANRLDRYPRSTVRSSQYLR